MQITPEKRKRAFVLVGTSFIVGLLLYAFGSEDWKQVGLFLVFMWIAPCSYVLFFFAKKSPPAVAAIPRFDQNSPFVPSVKTRIEFDRPQQPNSRCADGPVLSCLFLLETDGFSARIHLADLTQSLEGDAQFLNPARAMERFTPGTSFSILVDRIAVGRGEVLLADGVLVEN